MFPSTIDEADKLADNLVSEIEIFKNYIDEKNQTFCAKISIMKNYKGNKNVPQFEESVFAFREEVKMYLEIYILKSASILYGFETIDTISNDVSVGKLKEKNIRYSSIDDIPLSYGHQTVSIMKDANHNGTENFHNIIFTRYCMGWLEDAFYLKNSENHYTKEILKAIVSAVKLLIILAIYSINLFYLYFFY